MRRSHSCLSLQSGSKILVETQLEIYARTGEPQRPQVDRLAEKFVTATKKAPMSSTVESGLVCSFRS